MIQTMGMMESENEGTHDLMKAKIGDEADPVEFIVTEEEAWSHAFANDDYNPWYMEDSPFGGRIAPPTFLAPLEARVTWSYYAHPPGGTMNAKQEFQFINPLKIGKKIKITAKLVDWYRKRDRNYFVFEYLTVDEDGLEIIRTRRTRINPVVATERPPANEEIRKSGERSDPTAFKPMKITASRETEVGFELEPITKEMTLDKTRIFHGWPWVRGVHTDYTDAHKGGLRQPILQANQIYEQIGEMLVKFFGEGYLGGNLSVTVVRKMEPDLEVTTKGIVREKVVEGDAIRLILDVWCENESGETIIAGAASGLVR
ncbi:MaoC family dehydratase [Chloroflexota bacterium]